MPFYLVYTSLPRVEMSKPLLDDITRVSIRNNERVGVTGILLGIESRYLQYLEGEQEEVLALFERIKQDPRHYEVNKWIQGTTERRIFSEWSMASWMLSKQELENLDALTQIREFLEDPIKREFPSGRFLEMIQNLLESWLEHDSDRFQRRHFE